MDAGNIIDDIPPSELVTFSVGTSPLNEEVLPAVEVFIVVTLFDEFFLDVCGVCGCVVGTIEGESVAVLKLDASESRDIDLRERSERVDLLEFCVSDLVNDGYDLSASFGFEEEFPMVTFCV